MAHVNLQQNTVTAKLSTSFVHEITKQGSFQVYMNHFAFVQYSEKCLGAKSRQKKTKRMTILCAGCFHVFRLALE